MGEAKRKAEMLKTLAVEQKAWGDRPIHVELNLQHLLAVCGTLQLALRHPQFKGPSADFCRAFVMDIKDQIPPEYPAIRRLIEMGFHPKFDE